MTPERWQQVARIYELAVDQDVGTRDVLLAEACAGDEMLRREVESLLRQDDARVVLDRSVWAAAAPLFDDGPDLGRGAMLGPYRVEEVIGAGGMGQVFSATDTRLDRLVAIKVLPSNVASDTHVRARFAREAKAIAALTHPHICTLFDVGRHNEIDFLVMELLEGDTLAAHLAEGPLPLDRALTLAIEIARALDHAHRHGIVHRDLKPANIMLTASGAKLLDFGLAKFRPVILGQDADTTRIDTAVVPGAPKVLEQFEAGDVHLTRRGAILGTVRYMAPEQIAGQEVDARSDLFSFGAVVYEMLTGRRAFDGDSASSVRDAILQHAPPPASSLQPLAPAALDDILRRCLAKNPAERWQTVTDIIRELQHVLESIVQPRAPAPMMSTGRQLRRWIAGILAVALPGFALWFSTDGFQRSSPSGSEIRVLAVLPFANAAQDPEIEYLCDGITESLIQQVARLPSLTVMARSTVFNFKDKNIDPREAGRQLGVDAILTGTVSQRSGRLRITAELVQVASGVQLWGNTFDRATSEVVSIQDQIANAIVDEGIRLRLSADERRALSRHPTDDPEAYEWYLRARHAVLRGTEDDILQARELLARATARDPQFVLAHLALAATYIGAALDGFARPIETVPQARRIVRHALEIDPHFPQTHASAASIAFFFDWDWAAAEREWSVLNQSPSGALPVQELVANSLGRWVLAGPNEALRVVQKLRAVDPLTISYAVLEADYLFHAGQLDAAATLYEKTIHDAASADGLFGLAEVRRAQGRFDEAINARRRAHATVNDSLVATTDPGHGAAGYGAIERAAVQQELEALRTRARTGYVSPLDLARAHAQLGDREEAFSYFDAAFADRAPGLVFLKVDNAWDGIRDDPRFAAAVRRVGLP
jgi:serine/threonine protein kinase